MISKLAKIFYLLNQKPQENPEQEVKPAQPKIDILSRKNVVINEDQLEQNFKQHSFDCDIFNCQKNPCAELVPDKIVGEPYVVRRTDWRKIRCALHDYIRENPDLKDLYKSSNHSNVQRAIKQCMKFIMPLAANNEYRDKIQSIVVYYLDQP